MEYKSNKLKRPEIFKAFMKRRFPKMNDKCYVFTWEDRFASGNPLAYMDDESKEIYIDILRNY